MPLSPVDPHVNAVDVSKSMPVSGYDLGFYHYTQRVMTVAMPARAGL